MGACKIKASQTTGTFTVKAADMPVGIKLCEDAAGTAASTSSFNNVSVFPDGSTTPVAGMPAGLKNTSFSLTLPPGTYNVVMVLFALADSKTAFVFEDCSSNALPLDVLAPRVQPSGFFQLEVS